MFILFLRMLRSGNVDMVHITTTIPATMQRKRAKFRSVPINFPCKKMPKFSTCRTIITAGTTCPENIGWREELVG